MEYNAIIGGKFYHRLPAYEEVRGYFIEPRLEDWDFGGRCQAGFTIMGARGTDDLPPFRGREDIHLTLTFDPEAGFFIIHDVSGASPSVSSFAHRKECDNLASLPLRELDETDSKVSTGFFVPAEDAAECVEHFLESEGGMSPNIAWIHEDSVPNEAWVWPD